MEDNMKMADYTFDNDTFTLRLYGRISSTNATETEKEIETLRAEQPEGSMVIDMQELEYISSAGLRIILRLIKSEPEIKIINAKPEVYEIFEMTGFTELIDVQKAYRVISVEGCEVIGQGANGLVYRLDPDTIIKVYQNPDSLPDIHRERELARTAFILGIPTAIPYDVVRVGDGYGSVFELLNATSFAKLFARQPENFEAHLKMYVDLLKKIHGTSVKPGDMPDMQKRAVEWVEDLADYLPTEQYEKLYEMMKAIPYTEKMLHGDYHVKNVMLQNDEVLLIDMDTLCVGHPIFELASMFCAYVGFGEVDDKEVSEFLGIPIETATRIWEESMNLYFDDRSPEEIQEIIKKARIVGYTRLVRRTRKRFDTDAGKQEFLEVITKHLLELIEQVDSLYYE